MAIDTLNPPLNAQITVPDNVWSEYTPAIQARIVAEYQTVKNSMSDSVYKESEAVLWNSAVIHFLRQMDPVVSPKRSWFADNVTGLMLVSFVLALAFGILGAWGVSAAQNVKEATGGFLDIAKLFAGALVGAAGATVVTKR
jgi:hypothetical protein